MNELISLTKSAINGEFQQTVNARELHAFLGSKQDFSTWIKNRIEQYDLVENQDFVLAPQFCGASLHGGHNRLDYYITLDMAKELAMVERTDKGKQARQYFIECEKQLKQAQSGFVSEQLQMQKITLLNTIINTFGDKLSPPALEALLITSGEKVLGVKIDYRPQISQHTYSANEIGERLGISGNKVGRLTKAHNLKTEEYGLWVLDKSAHSNKQVSNFRYYLNIVPVLSALIGD